MENKQAMILATQRLLRLCRVCPDNNGSAAYSAKVEKLQNAIDDLEDFHGSFACPPCPQDHDSAIGTPDTSLADVANITEDGHVSGQHQEVHQDPRPLTVNHPVVTIDPPVSTIDSSILTIDPPVSTLDPSVLTFEENYDGAPSPDQFGSPSLPNLVSSGWNEFDFVFNQDSFNQPEPQTPPTPLIDFELSSTDDLEQGGKSQTETENNQEGRDQGQDRNEHINHGRIVDCTDGALGGENCQNNQSDDTQNLEGLGQSPRIREEARGSVDPSLDLARQDTSVSTPKGKEDTIDVSSGTGGSTDSDYSGGATFLQ